MLTRHRNTPAHLYRDNTAYFVTGAIYQKRHLLANPAMKQELLSLIQLYFAQYGWELQHWVILDNHYHVLGKSSKGVAITTIMRRIHSRSAVTIARMFDDVTKPIWWNYWDYCPRDEEDYYTRLNYLLMNPIKHSYTQNLNHYEYSSYHSLIAEQTRAALVIQMQKYPAYTSLILSEAKDDNF